MRRFIGFNFSNLPFIGLLVISPFILFWRWLFMGELLFWGTLLLQFWPWHHLVKTSLLNGQWPLWNPLLGNGTPLLANLQTGVFYPPNLLFLLMPVAQALTLSIILHLLLAGLLMYGYSRQLGLLPFAAVISGLTYMFSGYLVGRTQFITMIHAAAWFPLLLLLSDKIVKQRRLIHTLWLALVLAVQLLAGHAQLWYYGLWLLGLYSLFRSWQAVKAQMGSPGSAWYVVRSAYRTGWRLGLAVVLALLLSAAQLGPTLEFTLLSPRGEGAEEGFALTYSFWPWRLITLLAPDFFGNPARGDYWGYSNYWEDHAYVGVLPFLLALVAIGSIFKQRHRFLQVGAFFAGLIPISLILALGWNTPVYLWVFETIPGFNLFQGPARLLIWYTVAMAVLAGIGAQFFEATARSRPNWRRLLAGCVALTIAGLIGELLLSGRALTFVTATSRSGILLILAISLLLLRPGKEETNGVEAQDRAYETGALWYRASHREASLWSVVRRQLGWISFSREAAWQWGVVVFVMIDLILAALPLIPTTSAAVFDASIASAEFLRGRPGQYRFYVEEAFAYDLTFGQYFRFQEFGPAEVSHWQRFKETLTPNFGVYAGIASANNNDPLVVGSWQQLSYQVRMADEVQRAQLLGLMNVAYLVKAPQAAPGPVLYRDGQMAIEQIPEVLPRAYFAPRAIPVKDEAEALAALSSPDFEANEEVVILTEDSSHFSGASAVPSPSQPIALEAFSPNWIQLQVQAPTAGFVVLTDSFYPGWEASVDGQPSPILQANLNFRAVAVEAGSHQIEFRYRPPTFTFGLWTSLLTCLIIIATIAYLAPKS